MEDITTHMKQLGRTDTQRISAYAKSSDIGVIASAIAFIASTNGNISKRRYVEHYLASHPGLLESYCTKDGDGKYSFPFDSFAAKSFKE